MRDAERPPRSPRDNYIQPGSGHNQVSVQGNRNVTVPDPSLVDVLRQLFGAH